MVELLNNLVTCMSMCVNVETLELQDESFLCSTQQGCRLDTVKRLPFQSIHWFSAYAQLQQ